VHPVSAALRGANGLTLGMASANALALGDPVKLDGRCSLEARSPDLRQSQAVFYALAFFWLDGFAVPAPAQVSHSRSLS